MSNLPPNQVNFYSTYQFPINAGIATGLGTDILGNKYKPQPPFEFGIKGRPMYDYYWIYILGCIFAFTLAMANGANDVANSFATSVGSKALKMWQAIVIASFCEFGGAALLGGRVTATVRGGIATQAGFVGHDDLLMFGMLVVTIVATTWVFLATFVYLPVSITHTVIGSILGMALCSPIGANAVNWNNVGLVVASWFISPALSGAISFTLFMVVRTFILRSNDPFNRAVRFFPLVVALTVTVCLIFIIFKAGIATGSGLATGVSLDTGTGIGISFGVGIGCGILTIFTVSPLLRRALANLNEDELNALAYERGNIINQAQMDMKAGGEKIEEGANGGQIADAASEEKSKQAQIEELMEKASSAYNEKQYSLIDRIFHQPMIDRAVFSNSKVVGMHASAEIFDLRTELAFGYLQIFTACFGSFSHGSNDVANAAGPLSSIVSIYNLGSGEVTSRVPVPDWVLLMCCAGLVVGLALFGHYIISSMGGQMIRITPSRGFCAELSFAFVVVFASFLGIPVSTTQCIVGAILGVGLAEFRPKEAINWRYFAYTMSGWIATLFVTAIMSAAIFSFVTFAPSQVYPLSANNCLLYYGKMQNTSTGSPASFNVNSLNGTLLGVYGYPASGKYQPIQ